MKREALNVTEVELFEAVDRWATTECERQGMTSDGETKRRVLGEDIVKGIRFPLMEEKDFVQARRSISYKQRCQRFNLFGPIGWNYSGNRQWQGKEEVIYGLFFFFCGLLSQTSRSTPNDAGVGPEIFKY